MLSRRDPTGLRCLRHPMTAMMRRCPTTGRCSRACMKKDPHWGELFRSQPHDELEIGAKIAEGGQAEIFEAFGWKLNYDPEKRRLVLKVFKKGSLQRLWPPEISSGRFPHYILSEYFDSSNNFKLCWPKGVHLLDDGRFAFIFPRLTSDLRKLIDQLMLRRNGRPPFSSHNRIHSSIEDIAQGMHYLHGMGILHHDLKAANVLVYHSDEYILQVSVADFESSKGIVGTGFWRAPEILLAVKNRNMRRGICTQKTDVYSFAMTCYEVITGRVRAF